METNFFEVITPNTTRPVDGKRWMRVQATFEALWLATKHAKERMAQRGVSGADAIKATKKSGAILSPDGAVVTVIPDAWVGSQKKAGARAEKMAKAGTKALLSIQYSGKVPEANELPEGYSLAEIKSPYVALILGKKHMSIKNLLRKFHGTSYHVAEDSLWIWGPNDKVGGLRREIDLIENDAIRTKGPPIPEDDLPDGHVLRRIQVPHKVVGHVYGRKGGKIMKLQEDDIPASINMNEKTGLVHLWGEAAAVDKAYEAIAAVVDEAKAVEKCKAAKGLAAAEQSRDYKMKQYEKDMEAFRKAQPDLEAEVDRQKNQASEPHGKAKESKRKQKQAAKEARTITITKEDFEAARIADATRNAQRQD